MKTNINELVQASLLKAASNHIDEAYKHIPDAVRDLNVHRLVKGEDGMSHIQRRYYTQTDKRKDAANSGHDHITNLNNLHFKDTDDNRTLHEPLALYTNTKTARNVNGYLIANSQHEYEGSRVKSDPEVLYEPHEEKFKVHNEAQAEYAEKLSNHIKKHARELPEEGHFYSGVKFDVDKIHKNGGVFHTPAFTSTSTTINIAKTFGDHPPKVDEYSEDGFSRKSKRIADNHIIHFKLPKGYKKGMPTKAVSEYGHENEYLLDKGQTWKITGHKRVNETSIDATQHSNNNKHSIKSVNRIHIWTVEPHDTKQVTEAKYHEPRMLKGFHKTEYDFVNYDSPKTKSFFNELKGDERDKYEDHVRQQHTELHNQQFGKSVTHHNAVHQHPSLYDYTKGSSDLNNYLAKRSPYATKRTDGGQVKIYNNHGLHKRAAELTGVIQKHAKPLKEDTHVYSGTRMDLSDIHKKGGVFHTPAFTSTSLHPVIAKSFGSGEYTHDGNDDNRSTISKTDFHIIHFHLPKGYRKGIYLGGISQHQGEKEYLLDKSQRWKIINHQKINAGSRENVKYPDSTRKRLHKEKVHIWTVVPHNIENIKEEFTPTTDSKILHDVKNSTPARTKLQPEHIEEHKHLTDLHGETSEKHNHAVRMFTNLSHELNTSLLNDEPIHPIWKNVHEKLQDMFTETKPLTKEHHVYTGLGDFDPTSHFKHADGVFKIKSYMSTSISPKTAVAHTNLKSFNTKDEHLIHFHLPVGYKGGQYVANHSRFPGEHEMILNHNQKFKLKEHKVYNLPTGNKRHIWSVIPHE